MNKYRWVCHLCGSGNAAELSNCSQCDFPSEASAFEIEAAKKGIRPVKTSNTFKSANRWNRNKSLILELIMFSGFIMASFGFSLKVFAIGTTILIVVLAVLYALKKKDMINEA